MTTDYRPADTTGIGKPDLPSHLHLRAQQGVYALYATPLSLRLCTKAVREYLRDYYLLLLSWSGAHVTAFTQLSLAQWLRQQGLQAHTIRSLSPLGPAQQLDPLVLLPHSHVVFTDPPLRPGEAAHVDVEQILLDTFASPDGHTVISPELSNRLYCESRDNRFTHVVCRDRALLAGVLSHWLRTCLQSRLTDLPYPDDFPPLIHEQLWQYATQGLAPQSAERIADGVEMQVALGTPDRSACVLAQSCLHTSQIQRGFILRWRSSGWEICSTEELSSGQG